MFIERLDKKDVYSIAEDSLSMVVDREKAKDYLKDSTMTKMNYCILLEFNSGEFVSILDFDTVVSLAIEPVQHLISNNYRRQMYRKFGSEYLNAIDEMGKESIELEYKKEMSKHNKMIEEMKKPIFAPFPDPKGVSFEEHIKTTKGKNSKFEPFPDPNGVAQDEFEK